MVAPVVLPGLQQLFESSPSQLSLDKNLHGLIFSNLDTRDLQAVTCVNKGMKNRVVDALVINEVKPIKHLILLILKNQEKYPGSRIALTGLSLSMEHQQFQDIRMIKSWVSLTTPRLISLVKTLDASIIEQLEVWQLSKLAQKVFQKVLFEIEEEERQKFQLLALKEKIEEGRKIPDKKERREFFVRNCQQLLEKNKIEDAIYFANLIPSIISQPNALFLVYSHLVNIGNMKRVVELIREKKKAIEATPPPFGAEKLDELLLIICLNLLTKKCTGKNDILVNVEKVMTLIKLFSFQRNYNKILVQIYNVVAPLRDHRAWLIAEMLFKKEYAALCEALEQNNQPRILAIQKSVSEEISKKEVLTGREGSNEAWSLCETAAFSYVIGKILKV